MKPYYEQDNITIYHGDSREIGPQILGVDTILTDPVWPNCVMTLTGADDPRGLFTETMRALDGLASRLVVQLGCDSDPRFLDGVPASWPFIRTCWLEYVCARPKGRILYTGDVAYVFGRAPVPRPGRMILPGRMISTKADTTRPRTMLSRRKSFEGRWSQHPCPRRMEHVAWLVKWFTEGLILDPFCGIGTTLLAAKRASMPAVGIEIEERYCEIAAKRLAQGVLFGSEVA